MTATKEEETEAAATTVMVEETEGSERDLLDAIAARSRGENEAELRKLESFSATATNGTTNSRLQEESGEAVESSHKKTDNDLLPLLVAKGTVDTSRRPGYQDAILGYSQEGSSNDVLVQKGVTVVSHKSVKEEAARIGVSASLQADTSAPTPTPAGSPIEPNSTNPTTSRTESFEVVPPPPTSLADPQQRLVRPGAFAAIPSFQEEVPTNSDLGQPPQEQPYTTTARLVSEEEDHAKRLEEELEQIKAAPTAEIVPPRQDGSKRWILPVTLVIAAVVVAVVVLATASKDGSGSGDDPQQTNTIATTPTTPNEDTTVTRNFTNAKLLQPIHQSIKERGFLRCYPDVGEYKRGYGVSLDLCRALSAAIFEGDPNRTVYTNDVEYKDSWANLDYLDADVSTSHITFNMRRDVYEAYSERPKSFSTPWMFSGIMFAGQPELVECAQQGNTLTGICKELVVCVGEATTTNDFVQGHLDGSSIQIVDGDAYENFIMNGTCNVMAQEPAGQQIILDNLVAAGYTGEYKLGTSLFSREPLSMVTRGDVPQWTDFCNSVLQALFTAEFENITQQTSALFPESNWFGEDYKHMYQHAIAAVGNWGEIYKRDFHFLPRTKVNMLAGAVKEEEQGGLLYSPPFSSLAFKPTLETDVLPQVVANGTMDRIGQRGSLRCGVFPGRPGFAVEVPSNATWVGIDVDLCRCMATALFQGTPEMVDFVALEDPTAGYSALANDLVDVVAGVPYNLQDDIREPSTMQGYAFSPVYFYGENGEMLTLVTNEKAAQWTDFVRWSIYGLIHAEENGVGRDDATSMPSVDLFGESFRQMFRLMVLQFGNFGDIYRANLEELIPRQGHNMLNDGSFPLINPLPIGQYTNQ